MSENAGLWNLVQIERYSIIYQSITLYLHQSTEVLKRKNMHMMTRTLGQHMNDMKLRRKEIVINTTSSAIQLSQLDILLKNHIIALRKIAHCVSKSVTLFTFTITFSNVNQFK